MCDVSICGPCIRGCPKEAGVANALGFSNRPCCLAPCPAFPLYKVNICVSLPRGMCMKIQVGCLTSVSTDVECTKTYSWGVIEDTWGRSCRVVNFNRTVPKNSFIRLRFCGCDGCEESCGGATSSTARLIKFEIDTLDIKDYLGQVLLQDSHTLGCVKVGCIAASPAAEDCCNYADGTAFDDLNAIPWGSEIEVGPIGQTFVSAP